ncbi:FAD/NAD(P)-binding protein [Mucilaginibacter glaciei]|uniref:FAD/NAD(P)-binding protein n=1 Tax=Mucilaginibacter glaciei TaxID=2772109 RepID=A0A926NRB6_9SPHI|nr:FAD/NAD(P)-binding protein [Mucilaginibacter glaciei]MBD1393232.1 FAD/NAD(P)-binding protein [Mucilaginibacter glaciei]
MKNKKHIAILGGGPSALFMFKRLVESKITGLSINIFERGDRLGSGMPYSKYGANDEHITNVSGNEIPELVTSVADWINTVPKDTLDKFHLDPSKFNDYKVLPRLLFGQYLSDQFAMLQQQAKNEGIDFEVHYNSTVTNITDFAEKEIVQVEINYENKFEFDQVVVCTGHNWPKKYEGKVKGWFDSPYPPDKLGLKANHAVAVRGSSLTAVDAIRTLGRHNGAFSKNDSGKTTYTTYPESSEFKIILHSRNGLLPAVRFHLEDSHLSNSSLLTEDEITEHIKQNGGFLSLDFIFEKDFKAIFEDKDPEFYAHIKDMRMEDFVDEVMQQRENADPFELMKEEYAEAERSIKQRKSVYWKEMLGVLSFAMNYPAKHFSAEDMLRLQKTLLPLISVVIAYIPQSSCDEMLAMHAAGALELISVGEDGEVEPGEIGGATYKYTDETGKQQSVKFDTYVDSVGQPHLPFEEIPYPGLIDKRTITPAKLKFKDAPEGLKAMEAGQKVTTDTSGDYYLQVSGVAINDNFQVVDTYGALNDRIYMMAVPYIGGFNPDYSGLDFCEAASARIITSMFDEDVVVKE